MISSRLTRLLAATILGTAAVAVAGMPDAGAAPTIPASCPPDPVTISTQVGVFYQSMGTAAGKYNASTNTSTLTLSLSLTTSRSSAWEGGGSASLSFGIATIEANTSYTVTKTTSVNKTASDQVSVPGHQYGYAQPKAEFRTYHIYTERTNGNCQGVTVTHDYGYFDAITAQPFFAECVAKSACTPKP